MQECGGTYVCRNVYNFAAIKVSGLYALHQSDMAELRMLTRPGRDFEFDGAWSVG